MIKACVFDVGNTLVNGVETMDASMRDLADWLRDEVFLQNEQAFIDTYKEFNRTLHHPNWSHAYGEMEWFKMTLDTLGIRGIKPGMFSVDIANYLKRTPPPTRM